MRKTALTVMPSKAVFAQTHGAGAGPDPRAAGYSRSARFGPVLTGARTFSALRRGAPSPDLGLRLDFSILETA